MGLGDMMLTLVYANFAIVMQTTADTSILLRVGLLLDGLPRSGNFSSL